MLDCSTFLARDGHCYISVQRGTGRRRWKLMLVLLCSCTSVLLLLKHSIRTPMSYHTTFTALLGMKRQQFKQQQRTFLWHTASAAGTLLVTNLQRQSFDAGLSATKLRIRLQFLTHGCHPNTQTRDSCKNLRGSSDTSEHQLISV